MRLKAILKDSFLVDWILKSAMTPAVVAYFRSKAEASNIVTIEAMVIFKAGKMRLRMFSSLVVLFPFYHSPKKISIIMQPAKN
jgi:hypothetical protein